MTADLFLTFAENQISSARKRRMAAAEKAAATKAERAAAERAELFGLWTYHHVQRRKALLEGPHGAAARELVELLARLAPEDATELIRCVEAFRTADSTARETVLALCDAAIVKMREGLGLPSFNDSIFDDPPTVFLILREMLE
jgi:hypothetical protein